jgi:hypothetical protein
VGAAYPSTAGGGGGYPTTQAQGGATKKRPYPVTAPGYAGQPRASGLSQPATPALPAKAGASIPSLTPQQQTWQNIAQSGLGQTDPALAQFIAQQIQGGNQAAQQAFGVPQTEAAASVLQAAQAQPQTFSPQALQNLINMAQSAGVGSVQPSTFNLGSILQAAQAASTAGGGPIPLSQTFFQSPDAVSNLTQQAMQILQPYVQAQTQTAQTAYGQALQQLQNQWAGRGLLASGAAAGAEAQGASDLANTLAQIQGSAAQQALQTGMQYGQLGSQEAAQQFGEQQANQQFDYQRALQYVQNLLQGAGLEQAGNEFGASLQQQAAQNTVANYLQALGQQTQAGQFQQQLQNTQQQENIANAMALSQLFNMKVNPATTGAGLFGQIPQGAQTFAGSQWAQQYGLDLANLQAGLSGINPFTGQPTLEARNLQQQLALQQQQLAVQQAANEGLKGSQLVSDLLQAYRGQQLPADVAAVLQQYGLPVQAGQTIGGSGSGSLTTAQQVSQLSTWTRTMQQDFVTKVKTPAAAQQLVTQYMGQIAAMANSNMYDQAIIDQMLQNLQSAAQSVGITIKPDGSTTYKPPQQPKSSGGFSWPWSSGSGG